MAEASITQTRADRDARAALTYGATISEPDVLTVQIEPGAYDGDLLATSGVQAAIETMREMDFTVEIVPRPVVRWLDRRPTDSKNNFRVVHEARWPMQAAGD